MTGDENKSQNLPEPKSAGARVLKEILNTPAFRELIGIQLRGIDAENAGEFIRTALREDPNFSLSLAAAAPGFFNSFVEIFIELGRQIDSLPEGLRDEFMARLRDEIDKEALAELPRAWTAHFTQILPLIINAKMHALAAVADALAQMPEDRRRALLEQSIANLEPGALVEAVNAWATLLINIHKENPELGEKLRPLLEKAVDAADLGKVRLAVEAASQFGAEISDHLTRSLMGNPAAAANLFGMIAPLANGLIRALSDTLENLDMAPEITASGLFSVIEDINGKQLGKFATLAAGLICDLHAGSLVLGLNEPQFKAVFSDLVDDASETLDMDKCGEAFMALAEDLEVVAQKLGGEAVSNPHFISRLATAVLIVSGAGRQLAQSLVGALMEMPDEDFDAFIVDAKDRLEPAEAAKLVNSLARLFNRTQKSTPDFTADTSARFYESLDYEQLIIAFGGLAKSLKEAALNDPGIKKATQPDQAGQRLNEAIERFNRIMDDREHETRTYIRDVIQNVDPAQLKKAVRHLVKLFALIVTSSAQVAGAFFRPMLGGIWIIVSSGVGGFKSGRPRAKIRSEKRNG